MPPDVIFPLSLLVVSILVLMELLREFHGLLKTTGETHVVSILVLMELLRELLLQRWESSHYIVSILVLMELLRESESNGHAKTPNAVSILVLMELLRELLHEHAGIDEYLAVSILVLMELLRESDPNALRPAVTGFNPCSNGITTRVAARACGHRRIPRRFQSLF